MNKRYNSPGSKKKSRHRTYTTESIGIRYPDEPLKRNYLRLVPDSLSNYRYYIYIYIYIYISGAEIGLVLLVPGQCYSKWIKNHPLISSKHT